MLNENLQMYLNYQTDFKEILHIIYYIYNRMQKRFWSENQSEFSQILVKQEEKMKQKLVESGEKIRQFGGYDVLIIQDGRHCNLKYFNKIII